MYLAAARNAWEAVKAMMNDPSLHMVIADELNIVLRYDYLPIDEIIETLAAKRADLHVVVTGRNAKPELIELMQTLKEFLIYQSISHMTLFQDRVIVCPMV